MACGGHSRLAVALPPHSPGRVRITLALALAPTAKRKAGPALRGDPIIFHRYGDQKYYSCGKHSAMFKLTSAHELSPHIPHPRVTGVNAVIAYVGFSDKY